MLRHRYVLLALRIVLIKTSRSLRWVVRPLHRSERHWTLVLFFVLDNLACGLVLIHLRSSVNSTRLFSEFLLVLEVQVATFMIFRIDQGIRRIVVFYFELRIFRSLRSFVRKVKACAFASS